MAELNRNSLIKPTLDTPFHIDFSWWRQNDQQWSVYLRGLLGTDYEDSVADLQEDAQIDWVDPHSAEVKRMDAIQYLLLRHFANNDDLMEEGSSLVESIFRVFLKNGNAPLSSHQLAATLERPANTILRVLSGGRVYRGLRPILDQSVDKSLS